MIGMLEKMMGVDALTDRLIAMDLLIASKSGIQQYALAATETATPDVKSTLRKHLFEAIDAHERLTKYMVEKGYYLPHDPREQMRTDRRNAATALSLMT